jgi:hypothetical protein
MENQNNVVENETVEAKTEGGAVEVDTVEVKEEKTFTQAELDKILNKKFAQWQKKTEEAKIEAERKAKLTEAEKLAEERKEFEAMRKQFEYEKRVNSTSKVLASNNLPVEFADFLIAESDEATTQRVDLFKNAFNSAVEKLVNERLKGNTPKVGTSKTLEVTKEQFKKMDLMQRQELFNKNRELYNKLSK